MGCSGSKPKKDGDDPKYVRGAGPSGSVKGLGDTKPGEVDMVSREAEKTSNREAAGLKRTSTRGSMDPRGQKQSRSRRASTGSVTFPEGQGPKKDRRGSNASVASVASVQSADGHVGKSDSRRASNIGQSRRNSLGRLSNAAASAATVVVSGAATSAAELPRMMVRRGSYSGIPAPNSTPAVENTQDRLKIKANVGELFIEKQRMGGSSISWQIAQRQVTNSRLVREGPRRSVSGISAFIIDEVEQFKAEQKHKESMREFKKSTYATPSGLSPSGMPAGRPVSRTPSVPHMVGDGLMDAVERATASFYADQTAASAAIAAMESIKMDTAKALVTRVLDAAVKEMCPVEEAPAAAPAAASGVSADGPAAAEAVGAEAVGAAGADGEVVVALADTEAPEPAPSEEPTAPQGVQVEIAERKSQAPPALPSVDESQAAVAAPAAAPAPPAAPPAEPSPPAQPATTRTKPSSYDGTRPEMPVAKTKQSDEMAQIQALIAGPGCKGIPTEFLMALAGEWKNVQSDNVGNYLKHLGVGWAKRKVAEQFKPEVSWSVVDGVLQLMMPTPLGTRLERFPMHHKVIEADPDGNEFSKSITFANDQLITQAQSITKPKDPLFITRRWMDNGKLMQINEHENANMTRQFTKKRGSLLTASRRTDSGNV